jgi:hypothetical protein
LALGLALGIRRDTSAAQPSADGADWTYLIEQFADIGP